MPLLRLVISMYGIRGIYDKNKCVRLFQFISNFKIIGLSMGEFKVYITKNPNFDFSDLPIQLNTGWIRNEIRKYLNCGIQSRDRWGKSFHQGFSKISGPSPFPLTSYQPHFPLSRYPNLSSCHNYI